MSEKETRKVYEYDRNAVRDRLIRAFKERGGDSTVADLAGLTGLPIPQIEAELPAVSDEYSARLKVTEKGEILYSFPQGMKSRYRGFMPSLKRALRAFRKGAAEVAKAAFKVWILVMLIGYFVLFIALALFAMVASVAVQQGGGSRDRGRRGGGLGGLWLTTNLLDSLVRIWLYSELFKDPNSRGQWGGTQRPKRPLHKAVFSHVFGDGDPNKDWGEIEKKAVVAFLQTHKGIMTLAEFMAITGEDPAEAELSINKYLLEFGGSPEVTENGVIYFAFPRLLSRVGYTPALMGDSVPQKRQAAFSSNSAKADRTFRFVNLFNLAFGGYFLMNAASVGASFYVRTPRGIALRGGLSVIYSAAGYLLQSLGAADPVSIIVWGLGIVPLLFSALFFAIPIVRKARLGAYNSAVSFENLRRVIYRKILAAKGKYRPEAQSSGTEAAKGRQAGAAGGASAKIADRLAAWASAEPAEGGYDFPRLASEQQTVDNLRNSMDMDAYAPGATIFDSDK